MEPRLSRARPCPGRRDRCPTAYEPAAPGGRAFEDASVGTCRRARRPRRRSAPPETRVDRFAQPPDANGRWVAWIRRGGWRPACRSSMASCARRFSISKPKAWRAEPMTPGSSCQRTATKPPSKNKALQEQRTRAAIRSRPILGSPLAQRGRDPRSPFALTASHPAALVGHTRSEAPKGRAARGSVSPRKVACRARCGEDV
jgi:hypothetical protein